MASYTTYKPGIDGNIPPVSPFYGKAKDSAISNVLSILGRNLFDNSEITLEQIKEQMTEQQKAVIAFTKTGDTFVDISRRDCNRLTFNRDVMETLHDQILNIIFDDSLKLPVDKRDVRLEMTHGDILYYQEGGFFEYHRDGDIRDGISDEYDQYSMVLCLDSGETNRFENYSGCTSVVLPTINKLIYDQVIRHERGSVKRSVDMDIHTYPQTCMKNYFVVFPSNALHKSHGVQRGDFKLALKFDIFIKKRVFTLEKAYLHVKRNYYCSCMECSPYLYKKETIDLIAPTTDENKMKRVILDLSNKKTLCNCNYSCCKCCCVCTCSKCIINKIEMCNSCQYWSDVEDKEKYDEDYEEWSKWDDFDEDERRYKESLDDNGDYYDDYYDEEDTFCNGYEYD